MIFLEISVNIAILNKKTNLYKIQLNNNSGCEETILIQRANIPLTGKNIFVCKVMKIC